MTTSLHQGEGNSFEADHGEPDAAISDTLIYCQNFNRMRSASKFNEIRNKIDESLYNIILRTETSWSEDIKSEEVFGSNYNIFRSDRDLTLSDKKSDGGVLIAVNANLEAEIIPSEKHREFEDVWVIFFINDEKHLFVSVYFPQHTAKKASYDIFFEIAESKFQYLEPQTKVHIYGDFNQKSVDFIQDEDNESLLLPIVGDNETLQIIFDKSSHLGLYRINHVRNQLNCYLDFIFTNCTEDFCIEEATDPFTERNPFPWP